MHKLALKDIVIKSPGVQIRELIIDKYGSIKAFSDAIELYDASVNKYLSSKQLGSSTFKIRMTQALGRDFHALYETDEEQISRMTSTVSYYIDSYNQKSDIAILEKLKKICLERELMEDYAVICRCYAHYYLNQGLRDRAYAYMDVAVNTMRDRENIDRFGLYLSDLIWMEARDLNRTALRKLLEEFDETIKRVQGPLTTGHMYFNLGRVYFDLGDLDKSEAYFKKVFEYHEDDHRVSFNYLRLGDVEKAKENYEKAVDYYLKAKSHLKEGDKTLYFVYDELAIHYYYLNMLEQAETYIDEIFEDEQWEITSLNHRFLEAYAMIKFKSGKPKAFIKVVKRLLNEIPKDYIYTNHHLALVADLVYLKKGDAEFLDALSQMIIAYYKRHDLNNDLKHSLERILGSIAIAKA